MRLRRREWLTAVAATAVAGLLPARVLAQHAGGGLAVTDLGDGFELVTGAGANVLVAAGAESLLLVDGGSAEHSAALRALLSARHPGRPVHVLFNTNWRPEHTGSNEVLLRSGARIFAHENTKLWLGADFDVQWEQRHYEPRPQALPTDTFYTDGAVEHGGAEVRYLHLPRAHTDGDVAVLFPGANLIAVSDLLAVAGYPLLDYATGGWIGGFADATRALLELCDEHTRVVPAVGPVQGRAALEAQLELATTLRKRVAEAYRSGASFADFEALRPAAEFEASRGDPHAFLAHVYEGAWGHVRALGGII